MIIRTVALRVILAAAITLVAAPLFGNPFEDNVALQSPASMSFSGADINDVLKAFSRDYGISVVMEDNIHGKVTANFENVTVGQALEAVLAMVGCGWEMRGNIIMVSQQSPVKRVFHLGYKLNDDLEEKLQVLLSESGQLIVDPAAASVMVIDRAANLDRIAAYLGLSDLRQAQVMIEARIVEVSLGSDDEMGINWSVLNASLLGIDGLTSDWVQNLAPELRQDNVDFGNSYSGDDIPTYRGFEFRASKNDVDFILQALAKNTNLDLLSAPRVATLNNEPAVIKVLEKVPYVSTLTELSQYGSTTSKTEIEFVDVGITLEATPQLATDGSVYLKIRPEISEVVEWFNGTPVVDRRSVETTIRVSDGGTVIIGGLLKDITLQSMSKTPILGDIPGLGFLFRSKREQTTKSELLVFISPSVIVEDKMAREIDTREENLDDMREDIKTGLFR
jgi:type IV pilus assembly protein PilQ